MKLYLAYGSNMNTKQMALRCPTARVVSASCYLEGYKLLFRGRKGNAYATVEKDANSKVPVIVWEIDSIAEKRLDRYEGFPQHYRKETVKIELASQTQEAMIYIMNQGHSGVPDRHYYEGILEAYQEFNLDTSFLEKALEISMVRDSKNFMNQETCFRCGSPLTIRTMSKMNEDVLCLACAKAEKSHPRYQEAAKAELEQVKAGNYNYPGLFAGKVYPFK